MFKKISLKIKLIISFMAVASLLLLQGFVSNRTTAEVSSYFRQVVEVTVENLRTLADFTDVIAGAHIAIQAAGLTNDPEIAAAQLGKLKSFEDQFADLDKKYSQIEFYAGEKEIYDKFLQAWKDWVDTAKKASEIFFSAKNASDIDKFKEFLSKDLLAAHGKAEADLEELSKFQQAQAKSVKEKGEVATKFGFTLGWLMIAFGLVLACAVGFIFSTVLSKQLRGITERIHESVSNTTSASDQLTGASRQLSSGSSSSASSLQETVASLEELSSMVRTNSDHAKEANALSQKSKDSAEHGEKEIAKLIQSMATIAAGSKKIEDIINVIDDIAFQTNLLALNAAVEAARAGEQGKGFAVVAEAVRSLAQRSAVAAKDITTLIKENVSKSEEGAKIAEVSGVVLTDIVTNVKKVSDLNNEISLASQEQSSGIQQISQAMNQLDRLTQENAASAEELNASSEVLQGQSVQFVELVKELRVLVDGESLANKPAKTVAPSAKQTVPAKASKSSIKAKKVEITEAKKTDNVIPLEVKPAAKKRDIELEAILPMDDNADPQRKVGGTDGF